MCICLGMKGSDDCGDWRGRRDGEEGMGFG